MSVILSVWLSLLVLWSQFHYGTDSPSTIWSVSATPLSAHQILYTFESEWGALPLVAGEWLEPIGELLGLRALQEVGRPSLPGGRDGIPRPHSHLMKLTVRAQTL